MGGESCNMGIVWGRVVMGGDVMGEIVMGASCNISTI